ncbi:hypothetical protein UA08_03752 [Talaromyces atroroseus]|uniref:non-specific serine/threonine protein kinase n=1 Tax=Talaromyces atroroseus TaxID=1441469 RepID=A0A225AN08_TALAT|nr:hypothetical protein UA08_03752 [Talaromyces atroroseus]OKL60833.1 hypothetical protein UA08_03752 [Talaromyces atroroseus]
MEGLSVYYTNNLLYTQERLSKYRPGGYHPVRLGGAFKNNRYEVNHKLGWGGFSTVWLAHDRDVCKTTPKGISVQLLDDFTHHGPNGAHQCLVFELFGPPVDKVLHEYYESQERLETATILRMSKQLPEGVEFIHRSGMGHGDISGTDLSNATKEDLFEVPGTPEVESWLILTAVNSPRAYQRL